MFEEVMKANGKVMVAGVEISRKGKGKEADEMEKEMEEAKEEEIYKKDEEEEEKRSWRKNQTSKKRNRG